MINEGRGVSDLNKIETENIFNYFNKNGFGKFEHQILNRIVEITFDVGNYDCIFFKKRGKYYINFTCPHDFNETKVKTTISHELNHFIEVSKIENKGYRYPNYTKIKKSLMEFNPKERELEFFKHLIYKTLDNEINANVSQTYTYLKSFNIKNKEELMKILEDYELRKEYKSILKFNKDKFKIDLVNKGINFVEFNRILIKNGVGDFLDFLNSDLERYIDAWFKLIFSNVNKLINKQNKIIDEVIEDLGDFQDYSGYPLSESFILNFNDYLRNNIEGS